VQHLIQNTTPLHPSYSRVVFDLMTLLACSMLAAYLLSLPLCLALPQSPAWPKGKTWNADELNNEFKGIYWNHIVNEENDCLLQWWPKSVFGSDTPVILRARPLKTRFTKSEIALAGGLMSGKVTCCATSTSTYCNSCLKHSQGQGRSGSAVFPLTQSTHSRT
jgi:hypothetical protein